MANADRDNLVLTTIEGDLVVWRNHVELRPIDVEDPGVCHVLRLRTAQERSFNHVRRSRNRLCLKDDTGFRHGGIHVKGRKTI